MEPFVVGGIKLRSNVPRQVQHAHFSFVEPQPIESPRLVSFVPLVCEMIGLDMQHQTSAEREELVSVLSGSTVMGGQKPWALAYGPY